jgi:hypothetical protein
MAVYKPAFRKPVRYLFCVFGGELRVRRESESAADEWAISRSVAYETVKFGALGSMLFKAPGGTHLPMHVYGADQLHERERLQAWLDGEPVPPPITREQIEEQEDRIAPESAFKNARWIGILQTAITAGVGIAPSDLSSTDRGLAVLVAGIAAVAVVGLWRRMLWGPIVLTGLNVLGLIEVVGTLMYLADQASNPLVRVRGLAWFLLAFRFMMLLGFILAYIAAMRYLLRMRRSNSV